MNVRCLDLHLWNNRSVIRWSKGSKKSLPKQMRFCGPANPYSFTQAAILLDCVSLQVSEFSCLMCCMSVLLILHLLLWKFFWIHKVFNIRFNQCGIKNSADIFSNWVLLHTMLISHYKAWSYKKKKKKMGKGI